MFREEGFERTGLRDIAKACEMLPGSLHYRYRAKEDILIDMMRLAIERTIRSIAAEIAGGSTGASPRAHVGRRHGLYPAF
jgi:AcrR family transcriptional regulator